MQMKSPTAIFRTGGLHIGMLCDLYGVLQT